MSRPTVHPSLRLVAGTLPSVAYTERTLPVGQVGGEPLGEVPADDYTSLLNSLATIYKSGFRYPLLDDDDTLIDGPRHMAFGDFNLDGIDDGAPDGLQLIHR